MNMSFIYSPEGFYHVKKERKEYTKDYVIEAIKYSYVLESKVARLQSGNELVVQIHNNILGVIAMEDFEDVALEKIKESYMFSKVGLYIKYTPVEIINESDANGNMIVKCSRRKAQEQCREAYLNNLKCGDIINARIMNVHKRSIFCDVGCGIPGILPVDSYCIPRVVNPADAFRTIREIKAIIYDRNADGLLFLSHKELLGTWEENVEGFSVGDVVPGVVTHVDTYGMFVTIGLNLYGLSNVEHDVEVGTRVLVRIDNISPAKMKVKLTYMGRQSDSDGISLKPVYKYKEKHIDYWKYTPDGCESKIIERKFDKVW